MTSQLTQMAVNTAMFDGHDLDSAFSTIQQAGYRYLELAYNEGYVGNLNASLFSTSSISHIKELLQKYDLSTIALGCTMNLAGANMLEKFRLRIRFAHALGIRCLNACTTEQKERQKMIDNLKILAPEAADYGCVICLENGGDYNYDAFTSAEDGIRLLDELDHPAIALNIDPGNMLSLCPELDPVEQVLAMLPYSQHFHIKDVEMRGDQFWFPAIGDGVIDYKTILPALAKRAIPCSLEIPLRMHRLADSTPLRSDQLAPLEKSLDILVRSRLAIEKMLNG
ncbi:sugar phosphate isomerase/epimerase [Limnobaculum zhutongyuii]|uniref:Sugar phosphate isomerase/epimerase n=1 Tax=Limnobaculum zhutongyuii TaxID=2498113 RepID=A0A411WMT3_9GAMM|nr:sugar phosphate isomerase/epimerase family protein [Limnobaculum zhutongyuii]QBH97543.1 sugar phosphate isomerase/epimerase [Limnobaculum zhutongyuii]TQS91017.1 sugar phosphate isomerase/epimerase [Limnobaculum zhutongyuii]